MSRYAFVTRLHVMTHGAIVDEMTPDDVRNEGLSGSSTNTWAGAGRGPPPNRGCAPLGRPSAGRSSSDDGARECRCSWARQPAAAGAAGPLADSPSLSCSPRRGHFRVRIERYQSLAAPISESLNSWARSLKWAASRRSRARCACAGSDGQRELAGKSSFNDQQKYCILNFYKSQQFSLFSDPADSSRWRSARCRQSPPSKVLKATPAQRRFAQA